MSAPEIRHFDNLALQAVVDRALADVPSDSKGAVVAYANGHGASLMVTAKIGEHWSVVGVLTHDWSGKLEGEAKTVFSWK